MEIKYRIIDEETYKIVERKIVEKINKENMNNVLDMYTHNLDKNILKKEFQDSFLALKEDSVTILTKEFLNGKKYTIKLNNSTNIKVFAIKTLIKENHSLLDIKMLCNYEYMDDNKNIDNYDLTNELLILVPKKHTIPEIKFNNFAMASFIGPPTKYW